MFCFGVMVLFQFQSTLPRGERLICSFLVIYIHTFQSTLPRGERQLSYKDASAGTGISIHAPARGATCKFYWFSESIKISIHAPARGATICQPMHQRDIIIFQSTLPRGERLCTCSSDMCQPNFNPRSREGSDFSVTVFCNSVTVISIHAPARGATDYAYSLTSHYGISIHAPARGATVWLSCFINCFLFQSTLPRGERHVTFISVLLEYYFNPRSREGSDSKIAHIRNIFSGNYVNLVKICK